jgi:hypothetical protein
MGLFSMLFGKSPAPKAAKEAREYFKMLSGYTPVFTSAPGSLYEMDITRAAIHTVAKFCSKLKPEVSGAARPNLSRILQYQPNPIMDTSKFLYRLATILYAQNTAFIIPLTDETGRINGYYPILPSRAEVMEVNGEPWLRYTFANGERAAVELSRCGIMTRFQYKSDIFGEDNAALRPTMELIHTQNEGIINGVKNAANIRFIGRLTNTYFDDTIKKERENFVKANLTADNQGGIILADSKYADIKQIDSRAVLVSAPQIEMVNNNVFNYFGTNRKIMQSDYSENEWSAFYEGEIETFALQASLVMTNMTFSQHEIAYGNEIAFTSNRMQYASNQTKLETATQLFDRGLLNRNGVMDIFNLPHVENGEKYYIRKEYAEINNLKWGIKKDVDNIEAGVTITPESADDTEPGGIADSAVTTEAVAI